MTHRKFEVIVIGGGAAGIAAARCLHEGRIDYVLVEARPRLGGRASTVIVGGNALDLGCGWFHSADQNPWAEVARTQGRVIDETAPPWSRPSLSAGFPMAEQKAFATALDAFYTRADAADLGSGDRPLSDFLDPNNRWNPLINAVSTYFSGAELARISARDLQKYQDSEVNWRVREGYGSVIADRGTGLNVVLNCAVECINWGKRPLRVSTPDGVVEADAAIITIPTSLLAQNPEFFDPRLPEKTEAAASLPLGLADKLFLSLADADEFESESRLFGRNDRTKTAIYHFRPFGRAVIECYFGGECALELEAGGEAAFFDFARTELTALLGHEFGLRIKPIAMYLWNADPFANGSYSYAVPGGADNRMKLAAPVDNRLFFAGESCSEQWFSTAHGAYASGVAAARQVIQRTRQPIRA